MSLHAQIKNELKDALRAKDEVRLTLLRSLLTAFTNELVANKQKPDGELSDDDALAVIKRAAKQRMDSIGQYTKGNRPELAAREQQELEIIQTYLPEMMKRDEIEKIAATKKAALGITDPSDKGKLMSALMGELKGKADGKDVKEVVDSLFS